MWYNKIVNDLSDITAALEFYDNELSNYSNETRIIGSLEKNAQDLSGIMAFRFGHYKKLKPY